MSRKPHIVVLVDWYLPGYKAGGPIRSVANMVRALSADFDFSIITTDTDFGEAQPYPNIKADCWTNGPNGERIWYFSQGGWSKSKLQELLSTADANYFYLNSLFSVRFALRPLQLLKAERNKVVLAPRGMLGKGALQIKSTKKKAFLRFSKAIGLYKGITWHASTDQEAQEIRTVFGKNCRVQVALNIAGAMSDTKTQKVKTAGKLNLFFLSRISSKKNLLEAIHVLQRIPEGNGDIRYSIFGPVEDEAYWQQCEGEIAKLPSWVQVEYCGAIDNAEIPNRLADQHALLLPTKHENYGHVILESFAVGCPAVISDQTAWRGLAEKGIGWDLPLTNWDAFGSAVLNLLAMDQAQFDAMSEKARIFASEFVHNEAVIAQNKALFSAT